MNVTTVITVHGTQKSERAGGLDAGEVSQFTIAPGQYDLNVENPNDLLAKINQGAYLRGEWVASIRIGDVDVVEQCILDFLKEFNGVLDDVVQSMSEIGMFCNADAEDLRSIVKSIQNAHENETGDTWRDWVPSR